MRILLIIISIVICSDLSAQWEVVVDSMVPFRHRVWSMDIAPDSSIWILAIQQHRPPEDLPKVIRSADRGESWDLFTVNDVDTVIAWDIGAVDKHTAFIALREGGMHKTEDGGKSWSRVSSFPYGPMVVDFFDESDGWAFSFYDEEMKVCGRYRLSYTRDGGNTWTHLGGCDWTVPEGTEFPAEDSISGIGFGFSMRGVYDCTDQDIILGLFNGDFLMSNDRGANWTRHKTPFSEDTLRCSAVTLKDKYHFAVATNWTESWHVKDGVPTQFYATHDGGNTWNRGYPEVIAREIHFIPGSDSTIVAISSHEYGYGNKGTQVSHDFGQSWTYVNYDRINSAGFLSESYGFAVNDHNNYFRNSGRLFQWQPDEKNTSGLDLNLYWILPVAVLILAFIIQTFRLRQLRSRAASKVELAELENEALRAQMNPHFVYNALNSLQSYINTDQPAKSNEFLTSFSRLIRGTMEATSQRQIPLKREIELLKSYLNLEKMRFGDRFDFRISISDEIDLNEVTVPGLITQPLVENAIIHGFKGINRKGLIELEYWLERDILKIVIKDNGVGFTQEESSKPGHQSTGIKNTDRRLRIIHPKNGLSIEVLKDKTGRPNGTQIIQYIHLDKSTL